MHKKMISI